MQEEIKHTEVWQPIETAPKDGTVVKLLCENDLEDLGRYCDYTEMKGMTLDGEWSTLFGNGEPTHWQPLPQPPTEEAPNE